MSSKRRDRRAGDAQNADLRQALAALEKGDIGAAAEHLGRILTVHPGEPVANNLFGVCLCRSGAFDKAVPFFERAIAGRLSMADGYSNLARIRHMQGRAAEACALLRKAVAVEPGHDGAGLALGMVLAGLGELDEAQPLLGEAVRRQPGNAEARFHLGVVLLKRGDAEEALRHILPALGQDAPADWHMVAGDALMRLDQPAEALGHYLRAARGGLTPALRVALGRCLKAVKVEGYNAGLAQLLGQAMDEAWQRPVDLSIGALNLLEKHPQIFAAVRRQEQATFHDLPSLDDVPLLRSLLRGTHIPSWPVEVALTAIRRSALRSVAEGDEPMPPLPLLVALAEQCFLNEYAWTTSDEESAWVDRLAERMAADLAQGRTPDPAALATVAAYRPLAGLPGATRLDGLDLPEDLHAVVQQQVLEPARERELRADLPRIAPVADAVSLAVQAQYEQHPYPRWRRPIVTAEPMRLADLPQRRWPVPDAAPAEMLIAGCGTGQHPIEVARTYRDCHVTAIDLSGASLAYARRKAEELGIGNISFAQADILDLAGWDRRFHAIESVGVLHHMRDPMAGWRILATLLVPGGVMRIGLYSDLARSELAAARTFIAEGRYGSDDDGIRRARQAIARLPEGAPARGALRLGDFYSTSSCRDLLFHVQELRFTLPMVAEALGGLGLVFLGFGLPEPVLEAYRRRFPADPRGLDLDNWHRFEQENPRTFAGMYQFRAQKPPAG